MTPEEQIVEDEDARIDTRAQRVINSIRAEAFSDGYEAGYNRGYEIAFEYALNSGKRIAISDLVNELADRLNK